jgi:hypothetical protein
MPPALPSGPANLARAQADFLAILPLIERWARRACRRLGHFHDREDAVADAVAEAWALFVHLASLDNDPTSVPAIPHRFPGRTAKEGGGARHRERGFPANRNQSREVRS